MRPGDVVRVKRSSPWYAVLGPAEGVVESVTEHIRLAWVHFFASGLTAEGWGWEEFEVIDRQKPDTP